MESVPGSTSMASVLRRGSVRVVRVKGPVAPVDVRRLREGVGLEEGCTAPARVKVVGREGDTTILEFTIHEGWKRQIRRMCDAVGLRTTDLLRTRLGPLSIEGLPEGKWREMNPSEVSALFKALGLR